VYFCSCCLLIIGMLSSSLSSPNVSAVHNVTPTVSSTPNLTAAARPNTSGLVASMPNLTAVVAPNVTAHIASGIEEAWSHPILVHSILVFALLAGSLLYTTQLRLAFRSLREQVGVKEWARWFPSTFVFFAHSFLWGCYGFHNGSLGIARFNSVGALLCLASFGIVAKCVQPRETVQPIMLLSIMAIVVFSIGVRATSRDANSSFAFSATCISIGMILLSSREFVRAVQYGSWEHFSMTTTAANFFQSLLLAQYSVFIHDRYYLVPNMIGILVFGAQLVVAHWLFGVSGSFVLVGKNVGEFREGEDQPLMPRKRGKSSMSNCNNFFSSLFSGRQDSYGAAGKRKNHEFGLPDHFTFPDDHASVGRQFEAWKPSDKTKTLAEATTSHVAKKSPFSPFDNDEIEVDPRRILLPVYMDTSLRNSYEPEFEPQHAEDDDEGHQENTAPNSLSFECRPFAVSGGLDCIL